MDPDLFRDEVDRVLGADLGRATPDTVRRFVAWFHAESGADTFVEGRYLLTGEPDSDLVAGIRRFLSAALDAPAEHGRQHLFVSALELWFTILDEPEGDPPGLP